MKVTAIIQARMNSTRLPAKVMKEIKGKTVLEHVINRVNVAKKVDEIIIATTLNESDNTIETQCEKLGVKCFRGSENDVLSRYYLAASESKCEVIIRITSDCPVIDNKIIDNMVDKFIELNKEKKVEYLSNFDVVSNTFPRGMDVEIITFSALKKTYDEATKEYEREHVTPYIYQNVDKFNIEGYSNSEDLSKYRFTLDTEEDFNVIKIIYESLYEKNKMFGMEEIIDLMKSNPFIKEINRDVKQKELKE
ncbi:glycosyltransferase family protein [Clostridium sp. ZBS12]|uniref:cytidylyltransferase domain-containing protein n=1 Tax=Clostridium sp. ZBS12 TaxID=2949972 RepID=UPI0020795D59|nr:glycosyltransferase family protein [Clostridium sp. ZBS12]